MSAANPLHDAVRRLAREHNAVILAHNYQVPEVQDVADFVGDSLGLAIEARKTDASVIVMCGVYFMAETAKIVNPERTVLSPDPTAGCSLADSITLRDLRRWKAEFPGAVVVSYVNTTAAIKAESDYCVTSGNAEAVVRSIPADREILFLPDQFLGAWLKERTGRQNMQIWMGECHVHAGIRPEEVRARQEALPNADLLIHPECGCASACLWANGRGVMNPRTYVLSTEGMVKHAAVVERRHVCRGDRDGHPASAEQRDPGQVLRRRRRRRGLWLHEADHARKSAQHPARYGAHRRNRARDRRSRPRSHRSHARHKTQ